MSPPSEQQSTVGDNEAHTMRTVLSCATTVTILSEVSLSEISSPTILQNRPYLARSALTYPGPWHTVP